MVEGRRLPGPRASVSHLQSMQGVESEMRAEGSEGNRLLYVVRRESLTMWTDGSPGLRRRSMSANQEHFLSAGRQRASSSMSWK